MRLWKQRVVRLYPADMYMQYSTEQGQVRGRLRFIPLKRAHTVDSAQPESSQLYFAFKVYAAKLGNRDPLTSEWDESRNGHQTRE